MEIPSIANIKTKNLGNSIVQITSGSGYSEDTIYNFTELFKGDECKLFLNNEEEYNLCISFFNGILTEGIEQTLV